MAFVAAGAEPLIGIVQSAVARSRPRRRSLQSLDCEVEVSTPLTFAHTVVKLQMES